MDTVASSAAVTVRRRGVASVACDRGLRLTARVSWLDYPVSVSPTIFARQGVPFLLLSREEPRVHVHVQHAEGEAKFWIEPAVELHANYGLKAKRLAEAQKLVEEHEDEIRIAWAKHFPG